MRHFWLGLFFLTLVCGESGFSEVTVEFSGLVADAVITGDVDLSITYSEGTITGISILVDNQPEFACTLPQGGTVNLNCTLGSAQLSDGVHTVKVRVYLDEAKAEFTDSASLSVIFHNNPPSAAILNAPFEKLSGTAPLQYEVSDEMGISAMTLAFEDLAGNRTEIFSRGTFGEDSGIYDWDTTSIEDGVYYLLVEATDTSNLKKTSEKVPVVIMNKGDEITFAESSTPLFNDGAADLDIKVHWNMPAGVKKIVAWVIWDTTLQTLPWNIEGSVGIGVCPHDGEVKGERVTSDSGTLVVGYSDNGNTLEEVSWFFHLAGLNLDKHPGETLPLHLYGARFY